MPIIWDWQQILTALYLSGIRVLIVRKKDLRNGGLRAFLDQHQIDRGEEWWKRITDSTHSAKVFVFLITEASVTSKVCTREWNTAESIPRPILPIKIIDSDNHVIADSDIPDHISRINYVNAADDWESAIDEILFHVNRYSYLYKLSDDLAQLVSENTARRFIEIVSTENKEAKKQLKRRVRARTLRKDTTPDQEFANIKEAWEAYNGQVLLLGDPGAGKTTTLLYHAQTLIQNYLKNRNQPLPVFATIAYWDSYGDTPLHEWLPVENDLPDDIRDLIYNGRAVLILDGLDELGSSKPINPEKPEEGTFDPRQRFMAHVQQAINEGNQVLITCRVKDYNDIGDKLTINGAIELQKLTDEQIETYLGDVPPVQTAVMADDALLDICRSPLLLSLIAFGYRDATDELKALPSMTEGDLRDTIFGQYIQASYNFEASRRELLSEEMPFTLEKVLDVLGHAAMINVAGGRRDDGADTGFLFELDGSSIIENILENHDLSFYLTRDELDYFVNFLTQLNIIEKLNIGSYRFLHLLLRDHLAFQYSIKSLEYKHQPRSTSLNDKMLGISPPMRALTNLQDLRYIKFALKQLENTNFDNKNKRGYAICLGEFGERSFSPTLINSLINDNHELVREASALSLGVLIRSTQAVPALINGLQNDNSEFVRKACAQAFRYINSSKAVPALIDKLENDDSEDVRLECAEALNKIQSTTSVSTLIHVLENDDDERLRLACAEALGFTGNDQAVSPLRDALQNDDDYEVQLVCTQSLGYIASTSAIMALYDTLEWNDDYDIQVACADALSSIGNTKSVSVLLQILELYEDEEEIQHIHVSALEKIGTLEALQAVAEWREKNAKD